MPKDEQLFELDAELPKTSFTVARGKFKNKSTAIKSARGIQKKKLQKIFFKKAQKKGLKLIVRRVR